jgi:hypothetical protein
MTADCLSVVGGRQSFIFHRRDAEYTDFGEKIVFTTKDTKFTKEEIIHRRGALRLRSGQAPDAERKRTHHEGHEVHEV